MKATNQSGLSFARRGCAALTLLLLAWCAASTVRSETVGPFTPDADTLHLWHLNEPAVPVMNVGTAGTHLTALRNGATLGNVGEDGFGLALSTYDGGPDVTTDAARDAYLAAQPLVSDGADNIVFAYAGGSGAFTYEAMMRIDFDPLAAFSTNSAGDARVMQILNLDADEDTNRVCQFRLVPKGVLAANQEPLLEFINLGGGLAHSITAKIPTTGADAMAAGNWYHVAVTYDGHPNQPDNLKLYWSHLAASRTEANLIGSAQMSNNLPVGCLPDFALGQTGRQSPATPRPTDNFVGLIDEVRVSGVARSAAQMIFASPAPAPVQVVTTAYQPPKVQNEARIESGNWVGANWLIAGALLLIVGLLGWLGFWLKRLVAATTNVRNARLPELAVRERDEISTVRPRPAIAVQASVSETVTAAVLAGEAALPRLPAPDDWKGNSEDNLDRHSATLDLCSEGFHGVLRQVNLQDLIQMECLNQRSSILEITTEKLSGRIYLERGEILHASAGKYSGDKAFIKLFSQRGGKFSLKPFEPPPERTIHCQWIHLLLEAARQRDEDTVHLTAGSLAFTRSTTNAEDILNMAALLADHPQVSEILVCSGEGATLFNAKCRDHSGRAEVCVNLINVAKSVSALLPLGEFEQVELIRPQSKTLIRGDQDCHLLIGMEAATIA